MELTLEEISAEFDRLVPALESITLEQYEITASLEECNNALKSVDGLIERIKTEGASYDVAMALEQHVEGVLPKRYPVASFTRIPSKTNVTVALESAKVGKLALIAGVVAAIIAGIYKLIKWVIQLLRGTRDAAKVANKEAAQAITATATVNALVTPAKSKINLDQVVHAEVEKYRTEMFLNPAKAQLSKMTYMLMFEDRPTLRNFYSEVCSMLEGKNDLFELTRQAIEKTTGKVEVFCAESRANKSTVQHSISRFFEQPLKPVLYMFAKSGLFEPEPDFQGQTWSRVKREFEPVTQEQYSHVIRNIASTLTSPSATKACDDEEASALMERSQYFSTDFYNHSSNLSKLEERAKWSFESLRIPDKVDAKLEAIKAAFSKFETALDDLKERARVDPNAYYIASDMAGHITSYQQDINFLSKFIFSVRFLQRDIGGFFRLMTTGETAILNALKSHIDTNDEGKFRDLLNAKRKEHQDTTERFKSYLDK